MLSSKNPYNPTTSLDHRVVLFPTRSAASETTRSATPFPGPAAQRSPAAQTGPVARRTVRDVVVLEAAGRLSDVVHDLDQAIQMALADGPRGVVCDLSAVFEDAEPEAIQVLATAGRHVRDWSAVPVAVASPDPALRAGVTAGPLGGYLIVTASLFSAISRVLARPEPTVQRLRLAPHPTVRRGSRNFVTHTLQGWGLAPLTFSAELVLGELADCAAMNATTDIDLSIGLGLGAIRLAVRDNTPAVGYQGHPWNLDGSRPTAVPALARAFGTLPTADGGKVSWAVINAGSPRPLTLVGHELSAQHPAE